MLESFFIILQKGPAQPDRTTVQEQPTQSRGLKFDGLSDRVNSHGLHTLILIEGRGQINNRLYSLARAKEE